MDCTAQINQPKASPCKHWPKARLKREALNWYAETAENMKNANARCPWWSQSACFHQSLDQVIDDLINGTYQFSPMIEFIGRDGDLHRAWGYQDRLVLHLLYVVIKPVLKHIISRYCKHLKGPNQIKRISNLVDKALLSGLYEYIIRHDVKSFYAHNDHQKLIELVRRHFDDPILIAYLEAIITIDIDRDGLTRLIRPLALRTPLSALRNYHSSLRISLSSRRRPGSSAFPLWTPAFAGVTAYKAGVTTEEPWTMVDRSIFAKRTLARTTFERFESLMISLLTATKNFVVTIMRPFSAIKILAGHPAALRDGGLSRGSSAVRPLDLSKRAQRASVAPKRHRHCYAMVRLCCSRSSQPTCY